MTSWALKIGTMCRDLTVMIEQESGEACPSQLLPVVHSQPMPDLAGLQAAFVSPHHRLTVTDSAHRVV